MHRTSRLLTGVCIEHTTHKMRKFLCIKCTCRVGSLGDCSRAHTHTYTCPHLHTHTHCGHVAFSSVGEGQTIKDSAASRRPGCSNLGFYIVIAATLGNDGTGCWLVLSISCTCSHVHDGVQLTTFGSTACRHMADAENMDLRKLAPSWYSCEEQVTLLQMPS